MKEVWRDCCGKWFGYYMVSNLGQVRNKALGRGRRGETILSQSKDTKGYPHTYLYKDSKQHTIKVHRLVAESFLGLRPLNYQIDHIDGDKENNTLLNLEYVTGKENMRRAKELGLRVKPYTYCKPRGRKLTWDKVKEIRSSSKTRVELAGLYNIHRMTVGEILRNEIWRETV